jgi:hypothetical protein
VSPSASPPCHPAPERKFCEREPTVSRQLQETSRGLVLLPPKSIAGNRVVALDPWTRQVLAAHRGRRQLPRGATGTSSPARADVPTRPGT